MIAAIAAAIGFVLVAALIAYDVFTDRNHHHEE